MQPAETSAQGVISGLPLWAQLVVLAFIGFGVMIGAAYVYARKHLPASPGKKEDAVLLSATLADARSVRELVEAMDQLRLETADNRERRHRDSLEERDGSDRLTEAVRDLIDAIRQAPPSSPLHPDFGALALRVARLERERDT